jgi:hypothetical protein
MVKRTLGASAGILITFVIAIIADPVVRSLSNHDRDQMLIWATPAYLFVGAVVTAGVDRARPLRAALTFAAVMLSALAVQLFTRIDRPKDAVGIAALGTSFAACVAAGALAAVIIRLATSKIASRRTTTKLASRAALPPISAIARYAIARTLQFLTLSALSLYFMWVSFAEGSLGWGIASLAAFAMARAGNPKAEEEVRQAAEGTPWSSRVKVLVRLWMIGSKRAIDALDALTFACVIGISVRASADNAQQGNVFFIAGPATTQNGSFVTAAQRETLAIRYREYLTARGDSLYREASQENRKRGAEAMRRCATDGNPDCQVMLSRCYREGFGIERDLEQARHWAWRAFSEHRHPQALNLVVVYLHEAMPDPYSELLNELQHPASIDRIDSTL